MTANPKDPQAELRTAIEKLFEAPIGWNKDGTPMSRILDTDLIIVQILALFQAHQQELLSELLGELPEKWERDYSGESAAFNEAIDQAVSIIERKIGELNG